MKTNYSNDDHIENLIHVIEAELQRFQQEVGDLPLEMSLSRIKCIFSLLTKSQQLPDLAIHPKLITVIHDLHQKNCKQLIDILNLHKDHDGLISFIDMLLTNANEMPNRKSIEDLISVIQAELYKTQKQAEKAPLEINLSEIRYILSLLAKIQQFSDTVHPQLIETINGLYKKTCKQLMSILQFHDDYDGLLSFVETILTDATKIKVTHKKQFLLETVLELLTLIQRPNLIDKFPPIILSGLEKINIQTLHAYGDSLRQSGALDQAINSFEKSLYIAEQLADWKTIFQTYLQIGFCYQKKGYIDRALKRYKYIIDHQHHFPDKLLVAKACLNAGTVARLNHQGDAITYLREAIQLFKELNLPHFEASAYTSIANMYFKNGKLERAMDFYRRILKIREELNHIEGICGALLNMSIVQKEQGKYEIARQSLHQIQAYYLSGHIDNGGIITRVYNYLGDVELVLGNMSEALMFFKESLKINRAIANHRGMLINYLFLTEFYQKKNDPKMAKVFLRRAKKINKKAYSRDGWENIKEIQNRNI